MPTIKGAETIKATQTRLLGVKIAQFRSCTPKLYSYRTKCRLKYLDHVVKEDKSQSIIIAKSAIKTFLISHAFR